jgi:hypothetical protein
MIWAPLLAYVTGSVDQELLLRNEYLAAENRILKAKIKGRLLLSQEEKATLAEIAHRLGRKAFRSSPDPSRDTPFRELETQLEQFAVNTRCSPGRILGNHTENQGADLFADTLPSPYLADTGDPRPIQTKPRAMPVRDGAE